MFRSPDLFYSHPWDWPAKIYPPPATLKFDLCLGQIAYDLVVDPNNVVCFYGKDHFLSNFFTAPIIVNYCSYPTVEHFYQSRKLLRFRGIQWLAELKNLNDPSDVKFKVNLLMSSVDKGQVESWKTSHGFTVFELALQQKFMQHPILAQKLLATGDALLVHSNPYETLWGSACNTKTVKQWAIKNKGAILKIPQYVKAETIKSFPIIADGRNVLGYLLMQTRIILKAQK